MDPARGGTGSGPGSSGPDARPCPHCEARVPSDMSWCPQCQRSIADPPTVPQPPAGRVTPGTQRSAAGGASRNLAKPDWGALGPRPTTRWHRTATTMGPGPKLAITAGLVALLVAEVLLFPWGRSAALSAVLVAVSAAIAGVVLAGVWRAGVVDADVGLQDRPPSGPERHVGPPA